MRSPAKNELSEYLNIPGNVLNPPHKPTAKNFSICECVRTKSVFVIARANAPKILHTKISIATSLQNTAKHRRATAPNAPPNEAASILVMRSIIIS